MGNGPAFSASSRDSEPDRILAEVDFAPANPIVAALALRDGHCDVVIGLKDHAEFASRVMALDALGVIAARDSGLSHLSTPDLVRVLAGEVSNWPENGGPDMPLVLHAPTDDAGLQQALRLRLGQDLGHAT